MSVGGNGSCTWTWDGSYWTCINDCKDGSPCNDIVSSPTAPSGLATTHPLTVGDPLVHGMLGDVKSWKDPHTGTATWGVPDKLFRHVAKSTKKNVHTNLDSPAFATQMAAGSPTNLITVVVDC